MKIAVCIRYGAYLSTQLGFNPFDNTIRDESLVDKINAYDENALEEALRIKDRMGESCEVSVITVGGPKAEEALRYCIALGADKAFHVCDSSLDSSEALITAAAIFGAIKQLQCDLILCGKKGEDTCRGQVGPYLAEFLGLPVISSLVKLEVDENGSKAIVHKSLGKGDRMVLESPLPALFTVEKGINKPRYPTIISRLQALDKEITRFELGDLEEEAKEIINEQHLTKLSTIALPKKRPRRVIEVNTNLSAADRLKAMLSGGGAKKKTEDNCIDEKTPEKAAEKFVTYLKDNGFLAHIGQDK
jgi:electron transfer flavoprotein beta subunit